MKKTLRPSFNGVETSKRRLRVRTHHTHKNRRLFMGSKLARESRFSRTEGGRLGGRRTSRLSCRFRTRHWSRQVKEKKRESARGKCARVTSCVQTRKAARLATCPRRHKTKKWQFDQRTPLISTSKHFFFSNHLHWQLIKPSRTHTRTHTHTLGSIPWAGGGCEM